MTSIRVLGVLLALVHATPPPAAAQRLALRWDLERRADRFDLPGRLVEVSGLDFGDDGVLRAHGDERGVAYRVDAATGHVDGGVQLGERPISDDFEGIASAGPRLFMVSSTGRLYEFREAPEGGRSPVRVTDTGIGGDCEVEGLAHDPGSDALLVACKTLHDRAEEVRIHRLPLDAAVGRPPPIRVPWTTFERWGHRGAVNPSGIEVDPSTGSMILVAARQRLLFEVAGDGTLLDVVALEARRHPQPEGVAVGPDGRLWIGDEGDGGEARLTVYAPRRGALP